MAKYEIEYEVIGHHYKTIEIPLMREDGYVDGMSKEDIEENYACEEYHGDPIEECIITSVSKVEEKE